MFRKSSGHARGNVYFLLLVLFLWPVSVWYLSTGISRYHDHCIQHHQGQHTIFLRVENIVVPPENLMLMCNCKVIPKDYVRCL